jgi:hypothetical protein
MNNFEDNINTPDGREWLAMQFVLGDLPSHDAEQFQTALADDLELCKLVAQSAQLIVGLAAIRTTTRVVASSPVVSPVASASLVSSSRRMWSVKATLVMALVLAAFFSLKSSQPELSGSSIVELDSLSHGEMKDLGLADVDVASDETLVSTDSESRLNVLDAPEWLVTAVELEQGSEGLDEDDEESGVF